MYIDNIIARNIAVLSALSDRPQGPKQITSLAGYTSDQVQRTLGELIDSRLAQGKPEWCRLHPSANVADVLDMLNSWTGKASYEKNLKILAELDEGDKTIDELTSMTGYRPSQVQTAVEFLSASGIVQRNGSAYTSLLDDVFLNDTLNLLGPWMTRDTAEFYDVARDVAHIILAGSDPRAHVTDVMLYGSALSSFSPRDIDLIVFHDGLELQEFQVSKYAKEAAGAGIAENLHDLDASDPRTTRLPAFDVLRTLGSHSLAEPYVVSLVGKRIQHFDAGSVDDAEIDLARKKLDRSTDSIDTECDIHGINNVFDLHVMHVGLLKARGLDIARHAAIRSCKDPTFWHRALSSGKLYDPVVKDFATSIEEKYPGALSLFDH